MFAKHHPLFRGRLFCVLFFLLFFFLSFSLDIFQHPFVLHFHRTPVETLAQTIREVRKKKKKKDAQSSTMPQDWGERSRGTILSLAHDSRHGEHHVTPLIVFIVRLGGHFSS